MPTSNISYSPKDTGDTKAKNNDWLIAPAVIISHWNLQITMSDTWLTQFKPSRWNRHARNQTFQIVVSMDADEALLTNSGVSGSRKKHTPQHLLQQRQKQSRIRRGIYSLVSNCASGQLAISPVKRWFQFYGDEEGVVFADFGISKQSSLRTGCGTPAYQAPEMLGLLPQGAVQSEGRIRKRSTSGHWGPFFTRY